VIGCTVPILSKYNLSSMNISVYGIKQRMWKHFVDVAHDRGQIVFSSHLIFICLSFFVRDWVHVSA